MICKNCKAKISDYSMFCASCGQKIEAEHVVASAPTFSSAFRKAGNLDGSDSGIGTPVVERKPAAPPEDTELRFSSGFKRADSAPAAEPTATPKGDNVSGGAYSGPEATHTKNRCPHCGVSMQHNAIFGSRCGKKSGESLSKKLEKKLTGIKMLNTNKKGIIVVASMALVLVIAASLFALCFGKGIEGQLVGKWYLAYDDDNVVTLYDNGTLYIRGDGGFTAYGKWSVSDGNQVTMTINGGVMVFSIIKLEDDRLMLRSVSGDITLIGPFSEK